MKPRVAHSRNRRSDLAGENLQLVPPLTSTEGFTRWELAALLGALAMIVVVALPALASNRDRTLRLQCVGNLRLAGEAFQQWGTDHDGSMPWRTPWCDGGLMVSPGCVGLVNSYVSSGLINNAWVQWYWLSNELHTPRVLICPSDSKKIPATDWGLTPGVGFLHPTLRNNAISYVLGLDVFRENRSELLAGDRNLRFSGFSACSSGLAPVSTIYYPFQSSITNGVHNEAGNFLFSDGSVEELSDAAFKNRMKGINPGDNGIIHFLTP